MLLIITKRVGHRKSSMQKFSAEIYKIGINPVVDLPERVLSAIFRQAGKDKGPIPVRGILNGAEFTQTLVKYAGAWRLYINGPMLKDSGLRVVDTGKVEIEFDPRPREIPMPPRLGAELQKRPNARTAFELLPASRQKEIVRYIASLKSEGSIERNVARVISQLSGADDEPPAFMRKRI